MRACCPTDPELEQHSMQCTGEKPPEVGPTFPFPEFKAVFRKSADPTNWGEERLLVLGTKPAILIEPEYAESSDQVLTLVCDVTDLSPDETADLLVALAEAMRLL